MKLLCVNDVKNFWWLALTSVLLFAGCSDYADEYKSDYKESYGSAELISPIGETPLYKWYCPSGAIGCNVLWNAFDGKNFGLESVLGTKWSLLTDDKSTAALNGVDDNGRSYTIDVLPKDLTPVLRLGGISGKAIVSKEVRNPYVTVYMGLKNVDLTNKYFATGFTIALSATSDFYVTLLEIKDGKIVSEYRNEKSSVGSSIKDVASAHVWLQDFVRVSGESDLKKFLGKANAVGVTFTSSHKGENDGFSIVGVAAFVDAAEDESSSSEEAASSSDVVGSSSSAVRSSSSFVRSSSSVAHSSSSVVLSSSSSFPQVGLAR